ncbi:hypothetical protein Acsp04_61630 [Actinomadura sp. NBRC 104425]|uniref:hypothetical protein n=1 Tax=Actinomadura sp. NBRC 104425 TaxID=3032204 RepID=UPI0024A60418|nr:hypothetical protein [Actinomadura sp. NBRC 104425]GLZ15928.1 hypothetical protein Acsp04_61630 [Actinomadura sp. NBRC 104425]
MQGLRHPYTRALYEPDGPGRVRVTTRDGKVGVYARDGHWLEGEKFDADPHMCSWITGPRAAHRLAGKASD